MSSYTFDVPVIRKTEVLVVGGGCAGIAAAVCAEMGVKTVDLYAVGERNYDKQPDGAHYNDEGNDILAAAVSDAVVAALREREKAAEMR